MTITIAGVSVAASRRPDLRIYLKKAALSWSAIVSVQDAFTVAELNALGIGNTVTLGADGITWTGIVNRLETRTGYSLAEIDAPVADSPGLNNYDAITDPAVTDDVTQGYAPGSLWFNTVSNTLYMCEDAPYQAAEWRAIYDPSIMSGSLMADGSVALTGNWNAGNFNISSSTLQSSVATGTAPFTVASETMVDNLNADMLDGHDATYFAVAGAYGDVVGPSGATADNFAVYNSTTGKLIKDGGAKLTDVPLLAGRSGGQTLIGGTGKSENLTLTSTSNGTLGKITTASQLESTIAIGTAPLTVTSTTVCPNLNASLLEGHAAAYFAVAGGAGTGDVVGPAGATADSIAVYNSTTGKLIKDGGATIAQIPLLAGRSGGQTLIGGTDASDNLTLTSTSNGTLGKVTTASQIESTISTGTAPIVVSSTTVCTNLNAAKVNGFADTAFAKVSGVSGGQTIVGGTGKAENLTLTSTSDGTLGKITTASQVESTIAIGTAPITVTSTTVCPNLNASLLEGHDAAYFAVAGSGGTGDVVGPAGATADSIAVYNSTTGKLIKDGGATIAQIPLLAGRAGGQTIIGGTAASDNLTLTSTSNGTLGKITTASQIESTIATGTAPIAVSSTTVCTNLNAAKLEGNAASAFAVAAAGVTNGNSHDHAGGDGANLAPATINFAATNKICARTSAGAGTGEEASLSEMIDLAAASVERGDILYRNATVWTYLHHGNSGEVLTTYGNAADPAWAAAAGGAAFWTAVPGSPAYASATTITLTDAGGANNYASMFGRGTLLKWLLDGHTAPDGDQFAMVVSAILNTDTVTLTIVGSVVGNPIGSLKYCIHPIMGDKFIVPGVMPAAALADISKTIYAPSDIYVVAAKAYYKTACATTGATWNIDDDTATIFGDNDIAIAAGATTGAPWYPAVTSMAHPPVAVAADSALTLDYVTGHATTPGADAVIAMVFFPLAWRYFA